MRHGALVFGAIVGANVFIYLFYAFVGRIVGVEGYGVVSALLSATLLIATPPATVAATVVAKIAADLHATGDRRKLRRLGTIASVGSIGIGLGTWAVVALAAAPIAEFFHLESVTPVFAGGALLAFSFSLPVQRGVFQGAQSFGIFAVSNIVEAVVKFALGTLLALRFGPTGAIVGLACGSLAATAYNTGAVMTAYGGVSERLRMDLRRIVLTSSGIGGAVAAVNALLFYDVIVVRHFFPALVAGLYGASALVGRALYTVVSFVPTIVLPKAAARAGAGNPTLTLLAAAVGTAAAIIAVAVVVVAIAPQFVVTTLAGKQFAAASVLVVPYTFALGALALANIVAMYNIGLRRFAFVSPLCVVAIAEICFVCAWHHSVFQVLTIVLAGHLAAFAATLSGVVLAPGRRHAEFKGNRGGAG